MPKSPLIQVYDPEGKYWYTDYENDPLEEITDISRIRKEIPLKALADFCDQQAGSRNNGEYVGTHRILAMLLYKTAGLEEATRIMHEIAEYGGLDGMSGVGGEESAFADFGIQD